MHAHQLVGRVGRFADTRYVELDTRGVYWCVMVIILTVIVLTSVQPIERLPELVIPDIYALAPATSANTSSNNATTTVPAAAKTYYAVVRDELRVVNPSSYVERQRLSNPLHQPSAIYPGTAIRSGTEGDVTVEFKVNRDGSVSNIEIITSEPTGVFDESALRATQRTQFQPEYTNEVRINAIRTQNMRPQTRVQKHFRYRMVQD